MKKFIYIFLLLISATSLFSQPSITWQRIYNGPYNNFDAGNDVSAAPNNCFYVVGESMEGNKYGIYTMKINKYGDTIWTRFIHKPAMSRTAITCVTSNDSGCVLTGSSDSSYTIKYNSLGDLVWYKMYDTKYLLCEDIIKTVNGGFIACGKVGLLGYVIKIDSIGNKIWEKTYQNGYITYYRKIIENEDNSYIIVGFQRGTGSDTSKALIVKLDSSGYMIWEKMFRINNSFTDLISISKIGLNYIASGTAGTTYQDTTNSFIIKFNQTGEIYFTKIFETTSSEYVLDMKIINSNKYVYSILKDSLGIPEPPIPARIMITDSLGNILTSKLIINGKLEYLKSIFPILNGDILFAGFSESFATLGRSDIYIIRTDSMLNVPPFGIKQISNEIPRNIILHQNYPNPFNNKTVIKFQIQQKGFVKLQLFDVLGREVSILLNKHLSIGEYQIDYNASNLSSGIYFLNLFLNNNFINSIKIIFTK